MGNIERSSLEDSSQTETDEPKFTSLPSRSEVKREIGRGGMGTVYLALDTELGTEVAVKVLTAETAQQDLKQRFHQEAKELASLDHPAIVRCIDFGTHDSKDYIVLEYVAGGNLGIPDRGRDRGTRPKKTQRINSPSKGGKNETWNKTNGRYCPYDTDGHNRCTGP